MSAHRAWVNVSLRLKSTAAQSDDFLTGMEQWVGLFRRLQRYPHSDAAHSGRCGVVRVKPRESRRNVLLAARMRDGNGWSDANILNLSSRGLALHSARAPSRGTYVEVRRGSHVIVGRVIWVKAGRFGLCAQDRLEIDSLIANDSPAKNCAGGTGGATVERRRHPRSEGLEWRYAQSRDKGRALEFASIAGLAFLLAACAYDAVIRTLSRPLSIISTQLAQTP